jgi:hypothetical protein
MSLIAAPLVGKRLQKIETDGDTLRVHTKDHVFSVVWDGDKFRYTLIQRAPKVDPVTVK